mgnify:CR=1 FL=1
MRVESHSSLQLATVHDHPLARHGVEKLDGGRAFVLTTGIGQPRTWGFTRAPLQAGFAAGLAEGETMPTEPLRVGSEYVIFQVTERQSAVRAEFTEEEQTRIRDGLRTAKQREVLTQYIAGLRAQADRDEAVFINPEILRYGDEAAEDEDAEEEAEDAEEEDEPAATREEDEAEPAPAAAE